MMKMIKINFGQIAFLLCNFVFLLSGLCLIFLGCVVLNDSPRILLSRLFLEPGLLAQPLLYYVSLALIGAGLIVCLVAMLGCWASCDPNSTLLMGLYMFLLIVLLLAETSLGTIAALCPQIIGVTSDRDQMVAGLMNNYGLPGRSQYTAAVDLAQTLLECCGMQSGSDYDGSKWWKREQETRHDLRVPHSCCFLSNTDEENSFLNPKPINSSLCQAKTNSRYQYGRHVKGCIDKLNDWLKEHVTIFLTIGMALVIIQLAVLLCALLVCLRKRNRPEGSSLSSSSLTAVESTSSKFSSKKHRRSEKNLTPRPERKTGTAQVHTVEENGFALDKPNHIEPDFRKNTTKTLNISPKKLNSNEKADFEEFVRRMDSPSSLPLVLRNEHFQRFNEYRSKRGGSTMPRSGRESPVVARYSNHHHAEGSANVYFTPHYNTAARIWGLQYNEADSIKLNGDLRSYFCKGEKYGLDNGTYESYQDT